jgi:excisionase family DNA binding protein
MSDLTIRQVAERLGVAVCTAAKYAREGRFPGAYQVNPRLWLIPESDLEGFQKPLMGNPKTRKPQ